MQNFKVIVFSIIILAGMGLVGYWAVQTIQPGDLYANKQKQKDLEDQNKDLTAQIQKLNADLAAAQQAVIENTPTPAPAPTPTPTTKPTPAPTPTSGTSKNQSLINSLQQLITDKIIMKEKSQGTRVGTIQTFFNIYKKTSNKVDNDFGKSTTANVIAFQKAVGLTADGQTGPTTYQKMIDWLKKQ